MDDILKYYNSLMVIYHSSAIEGSTLDFQDTVSLIEFGFTESPRPLEHYNMVQDHYEALTYVLELAERKQIVSLDELKAINRKVKNRTGTTGNNVFGSYDTASGEFRKVSVSAGGRIFPDAQKVPKIVDEILSKLRRDLPMHLEEKEVRKMAYNIHFDLVSIHPFMDGNGRIARLLMNYVEAYHDLNLSVVLKEDKLLYIKALEAARKQGSIAPFHEYMEKSREKSEQIIQKYIEENQIRSDFQRKIK